MNRHILVLSACMTILLSSCGGGSQSDNKNTQAQAPIPSSMMTSSSALASEIPSSIAMSSASNSSSIQSSSSISSSASSSSVAGLSTTCSTQECEAKHKDMVLKIYTDAINKKQTDFVQDLFAIDVKLHVPGANSGSTGEISHLLGFKSLNPANVATVKHIGADGDYVAVHWHLSTDPANEFRGKVAIDLYKFTGDKIVEHWNLAVFLSATTVSGNSLFSDLYQYNIAKPVATQASEAANKLLVTSTYLGIFNDKNISLIDDNLWPSYIQHNPYVRNGAEALKNFVTANSTGGLTFFATISDDDLVWTFSGNSYLKTVDIFRVDGKKMVEHYDVF